VGALYHDVGKLNKPGYFAENSPEARGRHRELTPEMSLLIIAAHTRDGLELGRYYNLPEAILEFMPEHHGTSLIEYFYHAAQSLRGEENVNEEAFRYPGPKPQRIETAIVMIADAAEAISRQMAEPSLSRLKEMVHEVAFKRLMDRQFEECPMTLQDLALIESACVRVLQAIYHQRPTYPKGGKPNPADLSQPAEQRRAVVEEAQRAAAGSKP
jgi:putative nucleotidyltransferase with HDIG domain